MGYWIAAFLITEFFSGVFKLIKGTGKAFVWGTEYLIKKLAKPYGGDLEKQRRTIDLRKRDERLQPLVERISFYIKSGFDVTYTTRQGIYLIARAREFEPKADSIEYEKYVDWLKDPENYKKAVLHFDTMSIHGVEVSPNPQ